MVKHVVIVEKRLGGRARSWTDSGALKRLNTDFYDLSNIRRGWSERPSVIASNIICSHRARGMSNEEIVANQAACSSSPSLANSSHGWPASIPLIVRSTAAARLIARSSAGLG
jgi:hypothetical protein